jgi:lipoprotein-anchoring transpeptidase ErfK/SrfK
LLGIGLLASAILRGAATSEGQVASAAREKPAGVVRADVAGASPVIRPGTPARPKSRPAPSRVAASATPAALPNPCEGESARKLVMVSVISQHIWLCEKDRLLFHTPVTTGKAGDDTPTGTFTVGGKQADTTLRPETGDVYPVDYWVPFLRNEYGFHDSPWQKMPYGSGRYPAGGSHGCIHVPAKAMKKLYAWADTGTTVQIT